MAASCSVCVGSGLQSPVILGESKGHGYDTVHDSLVVGRSPIRIGVGERPGRDDVVHDSLSTKVLIPDHALCSYDSLVC